MLKYFAIAVALGIFGMLAGLLIEWGAVSTWTSLSTDWLFAALVLPALGLVGGFAFSQDKVESRGALRALLALTAIPLCGFSNFMAFIIASRTWFADAIPSEHQALLYQILHPDVLPEFSRTNSSHASSHSETWLMYLIVGLIAGPLAFWFTSRKW